LRRRRRIDSLSRRSVRERHAIARLFEALNKRNLTLPGDPKRLPLRFEIQRSEVREKQSVAAVRKTFGNVAANIAISIVTAGCLGSRPRVHTDTTASARTASGVGQSRAIGTAVIATVSMVAELATLRSRRRSVPDTTFPRSPRTTFPTVFLTASPFSRSQRLT
jgi:hypothetical protein